MLSHVMFARGGPACREIGSLPALESLGSSFLTISFSVFLLSVVLSFDCLSALSAHLPAFSHNPFQPVPLSEVGSGSSTKTECDYIYGCFKKWSHTQKISPKMVNPRAIAGNAEEGI